MYVVRDENFDFGYPLAVLFLGEDYFSHSQQSSVVFTPSSRKLLFVTDKHITKHHNHSKCRVVELSPSGYIYNTLQDLSY